MELVPEADDKSEMNNTSMNSTSVALNFLVLDCRQFTNMGTDTVKILINIGLYFIVHGILIS